MTLSRRSALLAPLAALLCTAAVAQTRVCIGGDLDHLTEAQRSTCSARMRAVREIATTLRAPRDWHFVVVCGEEGWKEYADYSMEDKGTVLAASAHTDLTGRETFFRERDLDLTDSRVLQRTVAHEIASLQTGSKDETVIQAQLAQLLSSTTPHSGL